MSARSMLYVRIVLISVGIGAVIGAVRAEQGLLVVDMALGSLIGTTIALGCAGFEIYVFSNPFLRVARRVPPGVMLLIRAVSYGAVILFALSIPSWIYGSAPPWQQAGFPSLFALCTATSLVFSLAIEISRLLGREASLALVLGRYVQPRLEKRVVIFADIVGSTALAERIGEIAFHRFMRDVFQDIAPAFEAAGGDVHKYVGDAVIVTWRARNQNAESNAVRAAEALHARLAKRAAGYRKRYGTEAQVRVAIHSGEVAAGEIGDWKKEIALLGDVMNVTARIEAAAKSFGVGTVVSDDVAQQVPEHLRAGWHQLPPYVAAGKQESLTLWAIDAPDTAAARS